ncbi:MAG: transporter [Bacteroidetes bacterium]|nr:transporter [Bacteroidota bacterium]
MKPFVFLVLIALSVFTVKSQEISLSECQELARSNFPLIRQHDLITQLANNAATALLRKYYPQIQVAGQATWQSDVTKIPITIPNLTIPELEKDQYKLYAEVLQLVYDGGETDLQRKTIHANALVEQQKTEVEMYKLRDRINQTYFGILLMDEQLKQNEILLNDLQAALEKIKVMVKNGVSLATNEQNLEAELLNVKQFNSGIITGKQSLIKVMALLTGKQITDQTKFIVPASVSLNTGNLRPELNLLDQQINNLGLQRKQLTAQLRPKLNLFAQGGYGKPGLNMFTNSFEPYFIAGAKINWQFSRLYTLGKERTNIDIQQKSLDLQKEIFNLNNSISQTQQSGEIQKLRQMLQTDDEIVVLRNKIKQTSAVQLENGVVTSADFIREANAENQARQKKALHEMQLLLAEYSLMWMKGN